MHFIVLSNSFILKSIQICKSSAYMLNVQFFKLVWILITFSENTKGLRMEPWGAPQATASQLHVKSPTRTHWRLSPQYDLIRRQHCNVDNEIFYFPNNLQCTPNSKPLHPTKVQLFDWTKTEWRHSQIIFKIILEK